MLVTCVSVQLLPAQAGPPGLWEWHAVRVQGFPWPRGSV